LDEPGIDLAALVAGCHDALLSAVPSALGLSVTTLVDVVKVTISTVPRATAVGSSLRFPLALKTEDVDPSGLVLFAAGPNGALTDVAATLVGARGFTGGAAVLDAFSGPVRAAQRHRVWTRRPLCIKQWVSCWTAGGHRKRPARRSKRPRHCRTCRCPP